MVADRFISFVMRLHLLHKALDIFMMKGRGRDEHYHKKSTLPSSFRLHFSSSRIRIRRNFVVEDDCWFCVDGLYTELIQCSYVIITITAI